MDMKDEIRIPAPRQLVWDALNDPEILKQCITGCQTLEKTGDDGFEATVQAKVGPVKATFKGAVRLENMNAPESYTISGEGKGGAAGFAKGSANVSLTEEGDETLLSYTVDAKVGGKLAQIGARLIDSTARKYATEFFETFSDIVRQQSQAPSPNSAMENTMTEDTVSMTDPDIQSNVTNAAIQAADKTAETRRTLSPAKWIIILVVLLAGMTLFFGGDGLMMPAGNK